MKPLLLLISLSAALAPCAWAQSFCASDGQTTPLRLVERFISADCEACWREPPTDTSSVTALTLDWIVPSQQGDDAPLSAAASRDALMRLETLGRTAPTTSTITSTPVEGNRASTLRVAHGLPLGGYIGASIALSTPKKALYRAPWSAWLLLVETIPAGTAGTPTERNLVRNVLLSMWNKPEALSKKERFMFREIRPLSIPPGVAPERLSVVGWVQDAQGRVFAAAQSVCVSPTPAGLD